VPTAYVSDYYNDSKHNLREQVVNDDYMKNYRHILLELIGKAHRAGVKIVVGVDLGGYGYEPTVYVRELAVLIEAGLTPMEAIKAATSVPAQMLGQAEQFGSLKTGQLADIIAVAANPLNDISELERVRFVMSNGKIIRNDFKSSTYAL
jgi:imidazolonepropionase-like amidohydrolase